MCVCGGDRGLGGGAGKTAFLVPMHAAHVTWSSSSGASQPASRAVITHLSCTSKLFPTFQDLF